MADTSIGGAGRWRLDGKTALVTGGTKVRMSLHQVVLRATGGGASPIKAWIHVMLSRECSAH